jgi:hypothetical protein
MLVKDFIDSATKPMNYWFPFINNYKHHWATSFEVIKISIEVASCSSVIQHYFISKFIAIGI